MLPFSKMRSVVLKIQVAEGPTYSSRLAEMGMKPFRLPTYSFTLLSAQLYERQFRKCIYIILLLNLRS